MTGLAVKGTWSFQELTHPNPKHVITATDNCSHQTLLLSSKKLVSPTKTDLDYKSWIVVKIKFFKVLMS